MLFLDSFRAGGLGRGSYRLKARNTAEVPLKLELLAGHTADAFQILKDGSEIFSIDKDGNLNITGSTTVTIDQILTGNMTISGTSTFNGDSFFNGDVTLGDEESDKVNVVSYFNSTRTSGSGTYAYVFDTDESWSDASSSLFVLRNNGADRFNVYADGSVRIEGSMNVVNTLTVGEQLLLPAGSQSSPALYNTEFDAGLYFHYESSQNRMSYIVDGVRVVDYSQFGTVYRTDQFLFGNIMAVGGATSDGGFSVHIPSATERICVQWPAKDYNLWVFTEFAERDRDWENVWSDDGEPAFLFSGSLNPVGATLQKYFVIQTNHTLGYTRLVTGTNWDVHFEVDHTQFDGSVEVQGVLTANAFDFNRVDANPGDTDTLWQDDGTNYDAGTLVWENKAVILDEVSIGDPGNEQGAITVNGNSYDAIFKVNEFGGTRNASTILHRHANTAGVAAVLAFARARGNTSSHTIVQDGDTIGQQDYLAYNGDDYSFAAAQEVEVDGTPGDNDMPARFVWRTSQDGSQSPTEGMRLDSEQNVVCGNGTTTTTRTDNFLYIPTSNGAPTGTPTSYSGKAPMVYDTANDELYIYNGSWKSTTLT